MTEPVDSLRAALEGTLGVPFTRARSVRRLKNGDEIFPAMLEAIERARERVELETFIYWSGDIADRMSRALVDAANRGVTVRLLMDGVGSLPMPREIRTRLEDSKVDLRIFRPPRPWRRRSWDERTHRKILVCDDTVGFTGGVGIAEQWEGDAKTPSDWRESHFELRGPVVRQLRGAFTTNWLLAGPSERSDVDLSVPDPASGSAMKEGPGIRVQLVQSPGGRDWTAVRTMHHLIFRLAQKRVRLMTPYFVPTAELEAEMVRAARRGVEIEILVPGDHIDHRVSLLAGQTTWTNLLNAGIRIHRYGPTFPHAKVVTVDGRLATTGSLNVNRRSAEKDDEIFLNILDESLVETLDRDFDEDLRLSSVVDRSTEWPRRPLMQRVMSRLARLVSSQV